MTQTATTPEIETTAAAIERRRSPRQQRSTTAWLSAATGSKHGNGVHVAVRDLSLHGVGFISDTELRTYDVFWMVIAEQSLRLSTRLRIVGCRQRPDGKWDIGAEFF